MLLHFNSERVLLYRLPSVPSHSGESLGDQNGPRKDQNSSKGKKRHNKNKINRSKSTGSVNEGKG